MSFEFEFSCVSCRALDIAKKPSSVSLQPLALALILKPSCRSPLALLVSLWSIHHRERYINPQSQPKLLPTDI